MGVEIIEGREETGGRSGADSSHPSTRWLISVGADPEQFAAGVNRLPARYFPSDELNISWGSETG
jgi:hypothetical protein